MKPLFLSFVLFYFFSPCAYAQKEVRLSLENMPIGFDAYQEQIALFRDRYRGLDDFTTVQREGIEYTSFATLKKALPEHTAEQYISGVRMYFGLDLSNRIVFYYIPLIASRTGTNEGIAQFRIIEPEEGFEGVLADNNYSIFYAYNGTLYDLREDGVEYEEASLNISRYRFNVATKPGYPMSEVYAVFIPFQEIDALYENNLNSEYNTGNIYFNVSAKFANDKFSNNIIMTTIKDYNGPHEDEPGFLGRAANMIHPCPTNCDNVSYSASVQ